MAHVRIACWIPTVTNTHSHYVILIFFPLQQWFHERTTVLLYTPCTVPICMSVCLSVCLFDLKTIPYITFSSCIVDLQLPMQIAKPKRYDGNGMYQRHDRYKILCSAYTLYLCVLCGSENKQQLFPYIS